jgi:hypothetical protein
MDDAALTKLYIALAAPEGETEPLEGVLLPTPDCLSAARMRDALVREDWTASEELHRRPCPFCLRTEAQLKAHLWHPPLPALFSYARGQATSEDQADLAFHLEQDHCARCLRLVSFFQMDRHLLRLAEQVRRKVPGAVKRLGHLLTNLQVVHEYLTSQTIPAQFSTAVRSQLSELYLERQHVPEGTYVLQHMAIWDPENKLVWEQFQVLRPGFEAPDLPATEEKQVPPRAPVQPRARSLLCVKELDALSLTGADVLLLLRSFAAERKDDPRSEANWRAWARQALAQAGLDAEVRKVLQELGDR